ncbi:hypothetical protein ACQPZ8_37465 [Actinomadura nitritigenes]|uniref:hypothetical protein n=1 Tax=Actinomadura nitritigenes TaxID=134602 RepID=UPI003D935231
MALKLGELVAVISADDSKFHKALDRVHAGLERTGKAGQLAALAGAAAQLGASLGPAAGGAFSLAAGLGAAIAPAAGVAVALPAAAIAWKTSLAIMTLAVSDLGDALGAAVEGDAKKFDEALKKMPPAARSVARELGGALGGLKTTVQQAFFTPIKAEVKGLGTQLRTRLQSGAATAASAMGRMAAQVAKVARERRTLAAMQGVFRIIARTIDGASSGVAPLLRGLRELVMVGLVQLPQVGSAVGNIATRMGDWLQKISRSGQAARWFERAVRVLKQLGRIARNVGVTLGAIFGAAAVGAGNMLGPLEKVTRRLADWSQSARGRAQLLDFFYRGRQQLNQFGRIAGNLGTALGGVFKQAGKGGGDLLDTLEKLSQKLATWTNSAQGQTQLGQTFTMLAQVTHDLTTIMPGLVVILGKVAGFITSLPEPVRGVVSNFLAWSVVLGLVSSKFSPLLVGIGKTAGLIGKLGKSFGDNESGSRRFLSRMSETFGKVGRWAKDAAGSVGRSAVSMGQAAARGAAAAGRLAAAGLRSLATAAAGAGRAALSFLASAGRMALAAGRAALAVVASGLRMAGSMALSAARVVAGWALMGVQALLNAAKVAAAWLISMGPIALVVAAAIGAVVLIIKYWDQIVDFFTKTLPHWLKVGFDFIVSIIKKGASLGFFGPIGLILTHWQQIVTFFTKTLPHWIGVGFDFIVGIVKKAASVGLLGPIGLIISHWNQISNFFTQTLPRAVSNGINNVVGWVRRLPGWIISSVGNMGKLLVGAGKDVLVGFWNGLVSRANWLARSIGNLIRNIVPGPVRKVLGIASPSKVFAGFGKNSAEGLALGMTKNAGLVSDAAGALAGAALTGGQVGVPRPAAARTGVSASLSGRQGPIDINLNFRGADSEFLRFLRKIIRTTKGGNVQLALGG